MAIKKIKAKGEKKEVATATVKATVKAKVSRRAVPKSPNVKETLKHTRIQTAEGWKRSKAAK